MSQNLGHVLRKDQVKIAGSYRLDLAAGHAQPPQSSGAVKSKPTTGSPQVRIVENSPQGVILECTCPCGTRTYIQCDYASAVSIDQKIKL
ncbi:MAG: hypothetical protein Q7T18_11645 [Sedimentisphaerales bacterium]|nr:hypothetical protein [Sedimentisphaerales bacterium]